MDAKGQTARVEGYRPSTYGDGFADVYDAWYADLGDSEAATSRVVELADGGDVLELGVGTGRLAVPIAISDLRVVGLDSSMPMLDRFVARVPDTKSAHGVRADMACLPFASASFSVVLAAYNVMFNLPDRDSQARCMHDVRHVLRSGGAFLVETFVPVVDDEPRSGIEVRAVTIDSVLLTAAQLEPSAQTITGQHVEITESGVRLRPWFIHYLHLDELDRLADDAGFVLEHRWAGWRWQRFSDRADTQVSVYRCDG